MTSQRKMPVLSVLLLASFFFSTGYTKDRVNTTSPQNDISSIVIHGKAFQVENNLRDIAQALYLTVNYQQWPDVKRFLTAYQKLPGHDAILINFAQGGLARSEGNLTLAASIYENILRQKPDFTRIKLELARVYFEDQKNREAKQLMDELSKQEQLPKIVLKNIDGYIKAIAQRDRWRSSFSLSYIYDNNINMSPNMKSTCLLFIDGKCKVEREIPKGIKTWGSAYHGTLSRRYQLAGHHGIFGRGMIDGEFYPYYHDENENTFSLIGGYSFKSRDYDLSIAPLFEYKLQSGTPEYHAVGARIEGLWAITARTVLSTDLEHKRFSYRPVYHWKNGDIFSSYFTLSHLISHSFTLFGGTNWSYRNSKQPANRYQQWGATAGISGPLSSGIDGSLFMTLEHQRFGAYNALLGARREENKQIYTASAKFPVAQILGVTPSITFRHTRNRSSVGWLYSYNKNEVQIQLEKYF
ncbi:porin family protein [Xenorhabdus innexi]|uniref:DUF560 domain-containing protein n=1 Tax=Xenorhabdus innexi TaxID=290109 RepID=A0A1N6MXT9_9GAMM|nr:porin family protein [Xenorhabdus innexi]PHM38852.1 hypothetical protein Xinn_00138 [Xenorhabdus innexi]SIP73703.1 conserved exported hypothetical protein [Xenorhabdus innexi]